MAQRLYDGTSAYKIEEYYSYTEKAQQHQEETKAQIKKRSVLNTKKLVRTFAVVFVVAIAFLWVNAALLESGAEVSALTSELEDAKARNTQLSFKIVSDVDLEKVETKAVNEYGMQKPESYQNVYVDVVQSDYAKVMGATEADSGFIDSMIKKLRSFLAYIG